MVVFLSFLFSVAAQAVGATTGALRASARSADAKLVERLRDGDERAFNELVQRYHVPLIKLAMNFVSSRAVAEEVVQETWLGVLQGLQKFEGRSALKTWIYRILTNRARTRGSRESRTQPFSSMGDEASASEAAVDPARFTARGAWAAPPGRWHEKAPQDQLLGEETLAQIALAMETLPASQRAVLQLRDVEGLDSRSVCNVLEITETNQRVLLHRARSKMRLALENYLGED